MFDSLDIFEEIAKELDVEVAAIKAVAHVESRGDGFLPSGHPKILFESHQFRKRTQGQYDSSHPTISHKYADSEGNVIRNYLGGEEEVTERLNVAIGLDREAALKSASWGKFQIMGFNHKSAGYNTVEEFVTAMKEDLDNHYWAFAMFVKSNPNMHTALKNKDWASFACAYNGEDYATNKYDQKMKEAYEKFKIN
ncbi:N-acetylmuramidase family protein [bacterium]|nr:N-acetylmuramidase family protein [bacterium]